MSDSLDNFAKELKAKREEKDITLSYIYERTRIDANYLSEMEKGNFDFMPDLYVRAFIRKYADVIDFPPEDAIKMYDAALKGKTVEELSETETEGSKSEKKSSSKAKQNEEPDYSELAKKSSSQIPIIIFLVVIISAALWYFLVFQKGTEEIIVEPKIEEILDERKVGDDTPRFEFKNDKAIVAKKISKVDSLSLKISAKDTIWFRIMIDDEKNDEYILNPNHSKTFIAGSKFNILLGNAGAIELFLNGKNLNFTGKKGVIRNISIDSNGFQYIKNSVIINE